MAQAIRPSSLAASLIAVVVLWSCAWCKQDTISLPYRMLRSIYSPLQLIVPHLPSCYTVPVALSGTIADEMKKTLDIMRLEPPRYEEGYDKKLGFSLRLANTSYPLETRELLAGVLNPIDMIDAVVSSALKYKSDDQFIAIVNETNIAACSAIIDAAPAVRITVTPKGKYFAYSYDDKGPYIRESWLSALTCILDTATHLVHQLSLMRHARTFSADQEKKPPEDSSLLDYRFFYGVTGGVVLPTELSLSVNGAPSLSIGAAYRKEGKYLVFDTRKICYVNRTSAAGPPCLVMSYGAYGMNAAARPIAAAERPTDYARHMEKAARLCRTARERLMSGAIESSIPLLKKILSDYPETPQAVEARNLLSGLPGTHETP